MVDKADIALSKSEIDSLLNSLPPAYDIPKITQRAAQIEATRQKLTAQRETAADDTVPVDVTPVGVVPPIGTLPPVFP